MREPTPGVKYQNELNFRIYSNKLVLTSYTKFSSALVDVSFVFNPL